jgi:hypothetical protein
MRKFYSLVLMAAALLIGTNAKAAYTTRQQVQDAFNDENVTEIVLQSDEFDFLTFEGNLVLNKDKHMVLDLNGLELRMNNTSKAKNAAIEVLRGTLEIKNGTIVNYSYGSNYTVDLIRVFGTTATGINAALDDVTPYSHLIIASDATIQNTQQKNGAKFNALTIFQTGSESLANGARIDVYGKLKGRTYGIKVNGNVLEPANRSDAAYIYVHAGSKVTSLNDSSSVAIYASGYARWRIEGDCQGNTGLYAKGGSVDIAGHANIESTATGAQAASTGKSSGIAAGGSAIVIESNAKYPGQIAVTISGESTIKGTKGYAIEETIANNTNGQSEVESVSIQGGSIQGGDAGAIIVTDTSKKQVQVVGGEFDGSVQVVDGNTVTSSTVNALVPGTTTDDIYDEDADFTVTGTGSKDDPIVVVPNTSKVVTLNAYGLTTFSATADRRITTDAKNAGLAAYIAEYRGLDQTLRLTKLENGVIPANTGVILYNANGADMTYALSSDINNVTADDVTGNELVAANYFNNYKNNAEIYILHDNLLYLYTGSQFKENKAFLMLQPNTPAPQRIRMVFHAAEEAQGVENVEIEAAKAEKFYENGQLFIRRGNEVYNVQGQLVK